MLKDTGYLYTVFLFGFISGLLARASRRARELGGCMGPIYAQVIWGPPGSWKEGSSFSVRLVQVVWQPRELFQATAIPPLGLSTGNRVNCTLFPAAWKFWIFFSCERVLSGLEEA